MISKCRYCIFSWIVSWMSTYLLATNTLVNSLPSEKSLASSFDSERCSWTRRENSPEVYYINMDKSRERKRNMDLHMTAVGLPYFRVRGLTPGEIYIPDDIEATWRTAWCKLQTDMIIPDRIDVIRNFSSPLNPYTSIMVAMCGRGKGKNTPKELGCTTSHLVAMRNAIYSKTSKSRYALITEDDVKFPFDIDFDALTSTAPSGFGILQLFNSNKQTMTEAWGKYLKDPMNSLWQESSNLKFWSTCAYLIDRHVMKSVIDQIIYEDRGWLQFKVIAGIQGPCSPPECCDKNKIFVPNPPCVIASFGYQADSYLYAMTKSYMINVPLISNGKGVDASTFHQEHVEMFHKAAFRKQRQIMNEMLSGKIAPPSFAKPACKIALNESEN